MTHAARPAPRAPLDDARAPGVLALAVAGLALGGALIFQYGLGLAPCDLCVTQRWAHGAAALAGMIALGLSRLGSRGTALGAALCALAFGVSAGIAAYHAGVEYKWWHGPSACTGGATPGSIDDLRALLEAAPVTRCDEAAWSLFGVSMAGYNGLLSIAAALALATLALRAARRS